MQLLVEAGTGNVTDRKTCRGGRGKLLNFVLLRVPGYRSKVPGSIPGATRFYEKYRV
jgi:hypothetical protein